MPAYTPSPITRSTAEITAPRTPYNSRSVFIVGRRPGDQVQMTFASSLPAARRAAFTGWFSRIGTARR